MSLRSKVEAAFSGIAAGDHQHHGLQAQAVMMSNQWKVFLQCARIDRDGKTLLISEYKLHPSVACDSQINRAMLPTF